MARPDAVIIPENLALANDLMNRDRMKSVADLADSLLECGPLELPWCHPNPGYYFCTRDWKDTEMYPTFHERAGQPRYLWAPALTGPEGVKFGFLK